MKALSKAASLAAAALVVLSAFPALAAPPVNLPGGVRPASSTSGQAGGQAGICARVASLSSDTVARIGDRVSRLQSAWQNRDGKFSDRWNAEQSRFDAWKNRFENDLSDHFAKLGGRATSTEQKAALTAFESAVRSAIVARNQAFFSAIQAFHQGMEQALASRKDSLASALGTFQKAVENAFAKAEADCAGGSSPATVRSELAASLKAARMSWAANIESTDSASAVIQSLQAARKAAFQKAQQDFVAAIEKATADLKAGWKTND